MCGLARKADTWQLYKKGHVWKTHRHCHLRYDWNPLQCTEELWVWYSIGHKGINSTFFSLVINMYNTKDPSVGECFGEFADWNAAANASVPRARGCRSGPDAPWMPPGESKEKVPRCSRAVVSRVNPSVAQVRTQQYNQGEVFKMSLQSMFGNQMQS